MTRWTRTGDSDQALCELHIIVYIQIKFDVKFSHGHPSRDIWVRFFVLKETICTKLFESKMKMKLFPTTFYNLDKLLDSWDSCAPIFINAR